MTEPANRLNAVLINVALLRLALRPQDYQHGAALISEIERIIDEIEFLP